VKIVKSKISIDWKLKESVQAEMRVQVKRVLKRHGYPPDKQKKAVELVMEQTKVIGDAWLTTSGLALD